MGALWVARVLISARTEEKINSKHGITADQVRDAVECIEGLDYVHHNHEVRGWRWLVKTRIQARPALVVLYDAEDPMGDVYRLGSAYFTDR